MWLLDANLPVKLVHFLNSQGKKVETAEMRGWKHLSNGMLVRAAYETGFRVAITRDLLFGESAAKALKEFSDFSVVVVQFKDIKQSEFVNEFKTHWSKSPLLPKTGEFTFWP